MLAPPRPARLALVAVLAPALLAQEPRPSLPATDPAITRAELEHHARALAADDMHGRTPVTAESVRAADYIARALAAAGLEPAGPAGFLQPTAMRRFVYPSTPRLILTEEESGNEVEAVFGQDFTLVVRGTAHSTKKLPLQYFYSYNHARMPLHGDPEQAIHFAAGPQDRKRILAEKGIENLEDWGLEVAVSTAATGLEAGNARESLPDRVVFSQEPEDEGCELVVLRGPVRKAFDRHFYSHVQLLVEEVQAPFVDANVVARIRGAGTPEHPERAQETVLFTANYDGAGRGSKLGPSSAANDNASGCAALLELAQALASGARPVRTLVFLFLAGAERGDIGLLTYMAAPAEPLEKTVCCLNFERLGVPDAKYGNGKLCLTGFERSNLGPEWEAKGFSFPAETRKRFQLFDRAHNYRLAQGGVVSVTFSSDATGKERTSPDVLDALDFAHMEGGMRQVQAAAALLADGTLVPAWSEGGRPAVWTPPEAKQTTEEERDEEREELRKRKERRLERRAHEREGDGDRRDEGDDDPDDGEPR